MVPAASVLVIGDHDESLSPVRASTYRLDDVGNVLLTLQQVGIAGMLVVRAQRLYEAHRRKIMIFQIEEEIIFILQVSGGNQIALAIYPRSVVVVIGKWLVVPLE